ncbi:Fe-S cluster assembly protein SufD [Alphaproteobacteria bacterium 46_93_T64]|nr:Fe-S cluster assembly protein SufD [Alphaproteobacteria bacterium 46_93_T64]
MKSLSALAQNYIDRFETALETLPGQSSRSISELRKAGLEKFAVQDFPNKRVEEWRFTNLSSMTKDVANEDGAGVSALTPSLFETDYEIVFIDGLFSEEQSKLDGLPNGLSISSFVDALENGAVFSLNSEEERSLIALNTAFMQDGFCIHVGEKTKIDGIVGIKFKNSGAIKNGAHLRNRITLDTGAALTLIELHEGDGSYFSNPVSHISIGEGARLDHYKLQNESVSAYHLALTDVEVQKQGIYKNFSFSVGGKISRNELKTVILGSDAESHLDGAYLMRGDQHCDTTTLTEHKVPKNISNQTYKGVLDDKAHGVFQGKIHIAPDAQQVAGDQLSKALLLSDYAAVDCKPELEIYADDVKCSHGATSGELDDDALFYLQARGIPELEARKILIEAFLGDVLLSIDNEKVREYFSTRSAHWLKQS